MRTSTNRHWLGLIVLGLLALPLSTATAEDVTGAEKAPALWVFDVRVVRIYGDPVKGLQPTPFEAEGSTTSAAWPQIIQVLTARGTADVLLDQRISAIVGMRAEAKTQSTFPIERFDNRAGGQEVRRFDRIDTSMSVHVKVDKLLEYGVDARWLHWYPKEGAAPTASTKWQGTHPPIKTGRSLFFASRRHIHDVEGKRELAEIYTIITTVSAPR